MKSRIIPATPWILFALVALSLTCLTRFTSSNAQESTQEKKKWKIERVGPKRRSNKPREQPDPRHADWTIEDRMPMNLPITVEIVDLSMMSLLRDVEVKVTNNANKPIYFLELGIVLPENLSPDGYPIGFPLRYGRLELIKLEAPLESDVPLLPSASCVLKIPEQNIKGFEGLVAKKRIAQGEVKKAYLTFRGLTFGDKTGFSSDGSPVPRVVLKGSRNDCFQTKDVDSMRSSSMQRQIFPDGGTFLLAGFTAGESPPQSNLCCPASPPATPCSFVKDDTYYCQCGEGRTTTIVGCQDPLGKCSDIFRDDSSCDIGGTEYTCVEFFKQACSAYCDVDNDGWYSSSPECGGADCDDHNPNIIGTSPQCRTATPTPTATPPPPTPTPPPSGCNPTYWQLWVCPDWNYALCECPGGGDPPPPSPIIIDVLGNGFALSNASGGVNFDLDNNSIPERLSWTAATSDDAFLTLDPNGNGVIDNGGELFGNFTLQPQPAAGVGKNGFLALTVYDNPASGGNGDGVIDSRDAIFSSLRLWQDKNHNGVSEPGELHPLPALDVDSISLDFKESKRTDQYVNQFRYRAKVDDARHSRVGRWAWDVFLVP